MMPCVYRECELCNERVNLNAMKVRFALFLATGMFLVVKKGTDFQRAINYI